MGRGGGDQRSKSCRFAPAGAEGVCGSLADGHHYPIDNWGSTEACIRPLGRDGWLVSSTREVHVAGGRWPLRARRRPCGGPLFGKLSGGNWIARWLPAASALGRPRAGRSVFGRPPTNKRLLLPFGETPAARSLSAWPVPVRIVTWLILPVVICLSQRLSHACLSISNYTVKLRMAH